LKMIKSIGICVIYGLSSIAFSFAAKYLFKILNFKLMFILILGEVFFNILLSLIVFTVIIFKAQASYQDYFYRGVSELKKKVAGSFKFSKHTILYSALYILNIYLGMKGLEMISLPMFVTLRKTMIFFVMLSSHFIGLRKITDSLTITSILLITIGAIIAGLNDLNANYVGYLYILGNNIISALLLELTSYMNVKKNMGALDLIFSNAINCLPALMCFVGLSGEFFLLGDYEYIYRGDFYMCFLLVCILGFCLNYTTFICATANSPIALPLTQNFKDIFSTTLGIMVFQDLKINRYIILGLTISYVGASLYSYTKIKENAKIPSRRGSEGSEKEIPYKRLLTGSEGSEKDIEMGPETEKIKG